MSPRPVPNLQERNEAIVSLYTIGAPWKEIAFMLGTHTKAIHEALVAHGVLRHRIADAKRWPQHARDQL
jgi:hypothetical protein